MYDGPWKRWQLGLAVSFVIALGPCGFGDALQPATDGTTTITITSGALGAGTTWQTPWYVANSMAPGPTVLVVGGIHGNEPAAARAARQVLHWPVKRGKLVVLPQVNRLGLAANIRWIPGHRNDKALRDLNRNFPDAERMDARTELAKEVWQFVAEETPDWVFDLHEGFDFRGINPQSVGSSVIAFPDQSEFAKKLVDAANMQVEAERQFVLLDRSGPIRGSLARACSERLGAKSFILETTFKDQPISTRTRQHRRMVSAALQAIGMFDADCTHRVAPANQSADRLRVGVFDGPGASPDEVVALLENGNGFHVCHLGPGDMHQKVLGQLDALVFPGGSGSAQGKAIGEERRRDVRAFVRQGGGIVGICAGAYLCSSHYDWSLDLMNAAVFNTTLDIPGQGRKSMWYRGPATDVEVALTERGSEVLGVEGTQLIRYHNGPILSRGEAADLPDYVPLAHFRSENGLYPQQKNTMIGAPAVVLAQYGAGRVLAISPHFESTPDSKHVVERAVRHVQRTTPPARGTAMPCTD